MREDGDCGGCGNVLEKAKRGCDGGTKQDKASCTRVAIGVGSVHVVRTYAVRREALRYFPAAPASFLISTQSSSAAAALSSILSLMIACSLMHGPAMISPHCISCGTPTRGK